MAQAIIRHKPYYPRTRYARNLQRVFKHWHRLLDKATARLARSKYPDCPFWYGERSHVGWLALAIFQAGWLPLQEPYVTRKKKAAGRTDLWAIPGFGKNCRTIDFEAKFSNFNLANEYTDHTFLSVDDIKEKLRRAVLQVKNKDKDHLGDIGVGLVFALLYTRKGTGKPEMIKQLSYFKKLITRKSILRRANLDFVALYVTYHRHIKKVQECHGYEPCPGVAVFGRFA